MANYQSSITSCQGGQMTSNGFSTLDDFRAAAQVEREARAEAVRMPSGLVARLVRPTPMEHLFFTGQLPQSLAARLRPDPDASPLAPLPGGEGLGVRGIEDIVLLAQRLIEQLQFIFVSPRVPDEARPGLDIPVPDVEYALRWARGEIVSGQSSVVSSTGTPACAEADTAKSRGAKGGAGLDLAAFCGHGTGSETVTPVGAVSGDFRMPAK
jgi:hypothetical protein